MNILVVSDLSPGARNALWRGALLAREHGGTLRVLHVTRDTRSLGAAQLALDEQCATIGERLGLPIDVEVARSEPAKEAARAAQDAVLLVLASRAPGNLREKLSGTPAERIMRACRLPTLVVKRPAAPPRGGTRDEMVPGGRYGRVLVSVALAEPATRVIRAAGSFARDGRIEVFHAIASGKERPLPQGAEGTAVERARAGLHRLIASAGAADAVPAVGFGDAAPTVLAKERATGADLLVLGESGGVLADLLPGGTLRQVLRRSRADVLVVPASSQP
jgi:nucleotide-binding universal stress UspA family protein